MKRWLLGILLGMTAFGVSAQTPALSPTDQLLLWIKPQDSVAGQILLFNGNGEATPVLQTTGAMRRVHGCGMVTSPNGQYYALYAGDDAKGTLFLLNGTGTELINLHEGLSPIACVGRNLQFSPDSTRIGYIAYNETAGSDPSPSGRLLVYDIAQNTLLQNQENVANFNLTNTGATWVNFFKGQLSRAVELAVQVWDGTTSREVSTLYADDANDCYYTTSSVYPVSGDRLSLVTGYKCGRGNLRHQWQTYLIDVATRGTTQLLQGDAGGAYFGFTRTTTVYAVGDTLYFTAADGLDNNTSSLFATSTTSPALVEIVPRYGIMPSLTTRRNSALQLSPDGRFLAVVQNDPNNNATLYIVDMGAPNLPPITISAGTRGSVVERVIFAPDSQKLFFIAGGASPENNAAFTVDLLTGTSERIARGRFASGAISPEGDKVALINHATFTEREPAYPTISILNLADGGLTVLYTGAQIVDNRVTALQNISVLSWRRGQ